MCCLVSYDVGTSTAGPFFFVTSANALIYPEQFDGWTLTRARKRHRRRDDPEALEWDLYLAREIAHRHQALARLRRAAVDAPLTIRRTRTAPSRRQCARQRQRRRVQQLHRS